ncbi:NACHT domain-containing protein [Streptomyces sp. NPDC056948]|uniref:NACHT domain-containing protein n=1 Tax=Streptomyces sp. NPDC056948 TaxID=3345975 RepID=UPI003627D539
MGDVLGTWSVGVGFLLGIAVLTLKDWLGAKAKVLLDFLYRRFAGSRLLRRAALAKYTHEVYRRHKEFPVSFQVDEALKLPMASVYVPLRGGSGDQLAASLREARHSVVLGVPGAGKTMLLRHEALMWARHRIREGRRRVDLGELRGIPVLLELHRLNKDATAGLEQHIVRHFERHGFPRAGTWVAGALDRGDLALYLDGLDEVNSDIRDRIVDMIKDFGETHPECRLVVTCRVAVYEGQFTEFHQTLRVQDFDEHLIRRFLGGWPWQAGTASDSVEQLLGALRDTPQIMSLTRNPLLLTMIAYLYDFVYAGTDQVLPHTRSEFYKQVIDNLLIDRRRQSVFPHPLKKAVLRRLALVAQDVPSDTHDRLALPEAVVLSTTRTVLERQGRDPLQAEEVIREIAHRSGLLLVVDNGERYQFAHLTLQECLAAIELAAEPQALLRRYTADPQAWRETVRLWCGVEPHDSSEVIRQVFSGDPVLAFQCLADAHTVDSSLAQEIVEHFQDRLEYGDEQTVTAFSVVASDPGHIGAQAFDFLWVTVRSAANSGLVNAAARALAGTNLPRAAAKLALAAREPSEPAWQSLITMGDLAVPAFITRAQSSTHAIHALWSIRTPKAALALNELLWTCQDPEVELLCAFHLGELLTVPEIASELCRAPVPGDAQCMDWVWGPFAQGPEDALIKIAGKIAAILDRLEPQAIEARSGLPTPDPRIIVPLVAFGAATEVEHVGNHVVAGSISLHTAEWISPRRKALRDLLPPHTQKSVNFLLAYEPRITSRASWDAPTQSTRFDYSKSPHYRFLVMVSLALSGVAAWRALQAATGEWGWGPSWLGAASLIQIVGGWLVLVSQGALVNSRALRKFGLMSLFTCTEAICRPRGSHRYTEWSSLWSIATVGLLPVVCTYSYVALMQPYGVFAATLAALFVLGSYLSVHARAALLDARAWMKESGTVRMILEDLV